jgi:LytS/YehU family sensor histidine kinase
MLLIPFIENAFKYSRIEEDENAYVSIHINTEHGKVIFKIENSIPTGGLPAPGSGLGIENVKHRLAIIYPDNHELNIHEREGVFVVDLQIDLT